MSKQNKSEWQDKTSRIKTSWDIPDDEQLAAVLDLFIDLADQLGFKLYRREKYEDQPTFFVEKVENET